MKHDTIDTINLLKSMIEEKRGQLSAMTKELDRLQDKLHRCETLEDVERVNLEFKDLTTDITENLKFIARAKKRIANFYKPAA